ncbi:hypothetical protein [Povalibacter sp.]|uniref:hypothetical protein n=1 Tax=Povalibacter sp. TaxID=1962978 RepID=UPI002F41C752
METFFSNLWSVLVGGYNLTASHGYPGCAVAFGVGLAMVKYAARLNGTPERLHGTLRNGTFDVHSRTDAVPGTGKGLGDWLIALFCNLAGGALLMIAVIAAVNVAMYGPNAPTRAFDGAAGREFAAPRGMPIEPEWVKPRPGSAESDCRSQESCPERVNARPTHR